MGELTTLARPYAIAVYKRAKDTGTMEQWAESLAFLSTVMEDEQMARAVSNPKLGRSQFSEAFLDLCRSHLANEAENFVRILIENHRLPLVRYILELYQQYKANDEGYAEIDVHTAYPLDGGDESRLTSVLERALKKRTRLSVTVDPSLIGGVYVRAGDFVIDASVRGQIERLAKRLCS